MAFVSVKGKAHLDTFYGKQRRVGSDAVVVGDNLELSRVDSKSEVEEGFDGGRYFPLAFRVPK